MKILHIGYPKTGTTFLQTRLFGPLARAGSIPAYVGNDGQIGRGYTKDQVFTALKSLGQDSLTSYQISNLRDFTTNEPNFLISVEGILGSLNEYDMESFSDRLNRFFQSDTEIVITVRDFEFYFDSWYQQRVKTDFIVSPSDLFFPTGDPETAPIRKSTFLDFTKFDLDSLVAALLKNFTKVTLIDARLPGYLSWLADRSGISVPELEELVQSKSNNKRGTNESLTPELVRLLEFVNSIFRLLFTMVGIRGVWRELPREKIRKLSKLNYIKYFLILTALMVKRRIEDIVRLLNRLNSTDRKYQLPANEKEKILNMIPHSKLLAQVREAGGVLTIQERNF